MRNGQMSWTKFLFEDSLARGPVLKWWLVRWHLTLRKGHDFPARPAQGATLRSH